MNKSSTVASTNGTELRLRTLWHGVGFCMLIIVTVLSLMPVTGDVGVSDKFIHLLVYACLSSWFSLIARRNQSLLWILVGLVGFGLLMEFLQGLTAYRSAELGDAIANSIGVLLGLGAYFTPLPGLLRKLEIVLLRFIA